MAMAELTGRGLVLLGCGKMGGAMLRGWLEDGLDPASVHVVDPQPAEWLAEAGGHVNDSLPADPGIVLVAVKPQMMGDALLAMQGLGNGATLFVSVAAGTTLAACEATPS